jgi:translation initiation factor 1
MAKHSWRDLLCPKCHQLKKTCACKPDEPSKSTVVRVGRETKGRGGKGVTIISDLPLDEKGLTELATKLKTRLGTGGTVKDGRIEIQGDHRDRIVQELEGMGFHVVDADHREYDISVKDGDGKIYMDIHGTVTRRK